MQGFGILPAMTDADIERAKADIAATGDLLERALKLSGLVTTLFQEQGFPLVVADFVGRSRANAPRISRVHDQPVFAIEVAVHSLVK